MKSHSILKMAIATAFVLGGTACSKSKSNKHPAAGGGKGKVEEQVSPHKPEECPNDLHGTWVFMDNRGQQLGMVFAKNHDNEMIWLLKDTSPRVINGKSQKDNLGVEYKGHCANKTVFIEMTDQNGTVKAEFTAEYWDNTLVGKLVWDQKFTGEKESKKTIYYLDKLPPQKIEGMNTDNL